MATIKDIADEVGISKTAVSRILKYKGSFSQDTILKVERVEDLGRRQGGRSGGRLLLLCVGIRSQPFCRHHWPLDHDEGRKDSLSIRRSHSAPM